MTSAPNNHLTIFNPVPKATDSFPQFCRLLPELRWMIWEQALSHERFLLINLGPSEPPLAPSLRKFQQTDETNDTYSIILYGRQLISKLFHINSESRQVASSFYRVHLPCGYRWGGQVEANGTLYVNPELDTLEISGTQHLAHFARRVLAHDRCNVGLVNLALPAEQMRRRVDINQPYRHFRRILSRLERVTFVYRGGLGRMSSAPGSRVFATENHEFYRSRPILASWLRWEDEEWKHGLQWIKEKGFGKKALEEAPGELEQATQHAVGFWLFPIEAFGPLRDVDEDPTRESRLWDHKVHTVVDLSGYKPELCLQYLP
ncbi:hypothetical protein FALBO_16490 [Fusarium albosuccineum]|uniref:2EXR domain-containing protein n=1 Tax=Fusarium albosuccineum TaxID=1237068 RepID=A0A8H4KFR7_9HYPO|nr:hypothetical protein FALBO_16490 [Fusarium albosuccineum]